MHNCGLVEKRSYGTVPPRTEYFLTDLGKSAIPLIYAIENWGMSFSQHLAARLKKQGKLDPDFQLDTEVENAANTILANSTDAAPLATASQRASASVSAKADAVAANTIGID